MDPNIPNNAIELTVEQRVEWVRKNRPEVYEERIVALRGPADYKDRVMDDLGVPRHLNALIRLAPLAPLIIEVEDELLSATSKFPEWSNDPQHAVGVLGEEHGELTREVVQLMYEPHKSSLGAVRKEAVQVIAMGFRFLRSMGKYVWKPAERHDQNWLEQPRTVHPDDFGAVVQQYGFESLEEFNRLVASVDLSSPEKIAAFNRWREDNGTKEGLLALLNEGCE